jgi:hypothetical protein
MNPDNQDQPNQESTAREYEKSGLYPKEGKPFRLVALLLSLTGVIVFLAVSALVLNLILI